MSTHVLVLAGGRGSRLGDVRKADLRIGGKRLFDRVAGRFPDKQLLVSTRKGDAGSFQGHICVEDASADFHGPVAGILAAAHYLKAHARADDILLTVAVDTPFLPADFQHRMSSALQDGAIAAYAAWNDQIYPTNAIYRLAAFFPALQENAPDSPRQFLKRLSAVAVDWSGTENLDPFANINTLSDIVALGRRAQIRGE